MAVSSLIPGDWMGTWLFSFVSNHVHLAVLCLSLRSLTVFLCCYILPDSITVTVSNPGIQLQDIFKPMECMELVLYLELKVNLCHDIVALLTLSELPLAPLTALTH